MKTVTTIGYTYSELNEEAKEHVKDWYIYQNDFKTDIFYEDIMENLKYTFPKSDLKVCFSLSSCQGDGLNISGNINLYDFLKIWKATEKEKRTIEFYIDNSFYQYSFEKNNRYCYSCKFIDKKYISDTVNEFITELPYNNITNIKTDIIHRFFNDLIDYFDNLDADLEKEGYKYIYSAEEEEIADFCEANEYYFTEEGALIA